MTPLPLRFESTGFTRPESILGVCTWTKPLMKHTKHDRKGFHAGPRRR